MELNTMFEDLARDVRAFTTEAGAIKADAEAKSRAIADITSQIDAIKEAQREFERRQSELERSASRPTAGGVDDVEVQARKAFDGFLRRAEGFKTESGTIEVRAMSTDVAPDGGYLVLPQFSATLIGRIFDASPVRQVSDVVTLTTGNSLTHIIDDDEASSGWIGEGQTVAATATPKVGQKTIPVQEGYAFVTTSKRMLEDGFLDVEGWLTNKISAKLARQEGSAFVNGDGVNKPRGFMSLSTTTSDYERDKIGQVKSGDADDLTVEGFTRLYAALRAEYHANAIFGMNRTAFGDLLSLNSDTTYHFLTMGMNNGQLSMNVLGRPVVFIDDMPIVSTSTRPVVFGDFRVGYQIVDRTGLSILRDPYSSLGEVRFFVTKRTGGDVTNSQALKTMLLATD